MDNSGHETVLYTFTGGTDGAYPSPNLSLDSAGNLYEATSYGGNMAGTAGAGLVFKAAATGHETVLYTFAGVTMARSRMECSATRRVRGILSHLGWHLWNLYHPDRGEFPPTRVIGEPQVTTLREAVWLPFRTCGGASLSVSAEVE